ncbi:2Fe-2S iron-sulfur cluster-binding protein, partial [Flavobacteriaceae bacterium]|nr:2Fe-2S iron-sulfur cluster-binding protein [Flavobacteriaceae bacterium]
HLELVPDKTLLDIALNSKLEVPYSCQGGVCSSCIAKVKEGKASMLSNQILTDSEILFCLKEKEDQKSSQKTQQKRTKICFAKKVGYHIRFS